MSLLFTNNLSSWAKKSKWIYTHNDIISSIHARTDEMPCLRLCNVINHSTQEEECRTDRE